MFRAGSWRTHRYKEMKTLYALMLPPVSMEQIPFSEVPLDPNQDIWRVELDMSDPEEEFWEVTITAGGKLVPIEKFPFQQLLRVLTNLRERAQQEREHR